MFLFASMNRRVRLEITLLDKLLLATLGFTAIRSVACMYPFMSDKIVVPCETLLLVRTDPLMDSSEYTLSHDRPDESLILQNLRVLLCGILCS